MIRIHFFIFIDLFRSSKIAQIKFCFSKHASFINSISFNEQLEYRMRSWWIYISSCLSSYSVPLTSFQQCKAISVTHDNIFWQPFNI